jgi:hypothetical protein
LQKESVTLVDDLDGSDEPGTRTVRFSWDGRDLEIDLSRQHFLEMQESLRRYVDAARPAGRSRPVVVRRTAVSRDRAAAIRQWARERGIVIEDRGRIPARIATQWEQETGQL